MKLNKQRRNMFMSTSKVNNPKQHYLGHSANVLRSFWLTLEQRVTIVAGA